MSFDFLCLALAGSWLALLPWGSGAYLDTTLNYEVSFRVYALHSGPVQFYSWDTATIRGQGTNSGGQNFQFTSTSDLTFSTVNGQLLFPTSATRANCPGVTATFNGVTKCLWDITMVPTPRGPAGQPSVSPAISTVRIEVDIGWDGSGKFNGYFLVGVAGLGDGFITRPAINFPLAPAPTEKAGLVSAKPFPTPAPAGPALCSNNLPVGDISNCRVCGNDCSNATTATFTNVNIKIGYTKCVNGQCLCPNGQGSNTATNCQVCNDACNAAQTCTSSGAIFGCFP